MQPSAHCNLAWWQEDGEKMRFARTVGGNGLHDFEKQADMDRMIQYRYARLQEQIVASDCSAGLFMGSANARYAICTSIQYALAVSSGPRPGGG